MSADTDRIPVAVLAVGGNVSQGILKALRRSALPLRILGTDVSADQAGLYAVDEGHVLPWASDPAFLPELARVCRAAGVRVLMSGCEPILDFLVARRAEVEAATGALCPVNPPAVHEIGEDKLLTCRWLAEHGFDAPRHAPAEDVEAARRLAETAGWPLVAKPRRGGGARGLFLVHDADDLAYACRKPGYLLQEYLRPDDAEYTVGCFCKRDGALAGTIVMRRELLAGTTYRAWVDDHPAVRRAAGAITAALRPVGPCNIQLRLTERGPVCFEINARFSGTTPLRAAFGFNEADAFLRHYLLGGDVALPRVTEGAALRYWNELYVPTAALEHVRGHGGTAGYDGPGASIEPFGPAR